MIDRQLSKIAIKDYTKTQLWNRTLAVQPSNDEYKEERDYYRTAYIRFRSKFEVLSREIALSMPQFTVHDITHMHLYTWQWRSQENTRLRSADAVCLIEFTSKIWLLIIWRMEELLSR